VALNRRSFLLGSGLTAMGLVGCSKVAQTDASQANIGAGATAVPSNETPRSCRPGDSLSALKDGNRRFATAWQSKNTADTTEARAKAMSNLWLDNCYLPSSVLDKGQAPWASILTCADSRVAPEWIFDAAPSDLFVIRSAGNTAFDDAIASLEYGVAVLKTPLIMVMGHSACGAVDAARKSDPLTPLLEKLVTPIRASLTPGETLDESIQANSRYAANQLTERSAVLADAVKNGPLQIVVSTFNIADGSVSMV
jgi:carbonic anhydrase